ncbi:uncharacterized protein LOC111703710 [Eurytemora carolleeae]|uniref:uncharacterized protein LOC111703710 n=1 Tax=Eurytemora carolleeae TaxID=1294199 RepID=UPI000C789481|nr:uncharacterized protein LOC111703710 [Eurytemora carolleeae]|eukprot:XP_023331506.1 uncharacterized protein LOC111703710 [Eurytemora affinis]
MAAVRIVQIPTDKVGLIIGFKGSTLRFKNDNGTYSLTINGVHNKAVERVVDEVERIFAVIRHSEIFSTLYCWNGKAYESAEIKLELHNGKGSLPLKAQAYKIKSISPSVAGSVFTSGEIFMQGYDDTKVENIFKEALNQKLGSTTEFTFRFSLLLSNYLLFIIQLWKTIPSRLKQDPQE